MLPAPWGGLTLPRADRRPIPITLPLRESPTDLSGAIRGYQSIAEAVNNPNCHTVIKSGNRSFEMGKAPGGHFLYQPHFEGVPLKHFILEPHAIHGDPWWVYDLINYVASTQPQPPQPKSDNPFDFLRHS